MVEGDVEKSRRARESLCRMSCKRGDVTSVYEKVSETERGGYDRVMDRGREGVDEGEMGSSVGAEGVCICPEGEKDGEAVAEGEVMALRTSALVDVAMLYVGSMAGMPKWSSCWSRSAKSVFRVIVT
jgi:hypothetical protein